MTEDNELIEAERERVSEIVAELKRRHPTEDWRTDPPCPDCGSMEHFECGIRSAALTAYRNHEVEL